jgi:lipopolysaccharide transport system permease protein
MLSVIRGDLKSRITRSYVGVGWFILHPVAHGLMLAVVLTEALGARLPKVGDKYAYAIFVLSGMAAWALFTDLVNRSLTVFIDQGQILKKIAFPRMCLPLIVLGSALVNHAMVLVATFLLILAIGHPLGFALFSIVIGIALLVSLAFGIGLILGVFNTFSRDVGHATGVFLQLWFWITPIVYSPDMLPEDLRWILAANPLTPLVGIYQDAFLLNKLPDPQTLVLPGLLAVFLLAFAFVLFRRASRELLDAL